MKNSVSKKDQWQELVKVPVKRFQWGSVRYQLLQALNDYLVARNTDLPLFPLTPRWLEEDTEDVLQDLHDVACELEWFDSEQLETEASVHDRSGRPVCILVRALDVIECDLK